MKKKTIEHINKKDFKLSHDFHELTHEELNNEFQKCKKEYLSYTIRKPEKVKKQLERYLKLFAKEAEVIQFLKNVLENQELLSKVRITKDFSWLNGATIIVHPSDFRGEKTENFFEEYKETGIAHISLHEKDWIPYSNRYLSFDVDGTVRNII